ncbi:major facilitator superfamily-domain-containing protein [Massariosphaeria phaeospora]|uniref:Major facilitator superfamily-domain-containing protein n=1 Tax=Massariosphaeria phaeospora TaxID=100035 RepID=A0A7C8I5P2_9PLEO|nr:major facilitator superfamily-domain-containing protein [Massariosphaeria phaeospora]
MSPTREVLFVSILCAAQFTTQMGLSNTLLILHSIGSSLHMTNVGTLPWLVAGYSLTVGSFILVAGRCGDVFGHKRMLVLGYAWFAVWTAVSGLAVYGGEVLFVVARVLSGMGPAILLPNALGLLGATYGNGERKNMVFSLFGACAPVGSIFGGLMTTLWDLVWWPWSFWTFGIALGFIAVLAAMILPTVPLDPEVQKLSLGEKIRELDLLGATVGITAMILFNFAWNQAPGFGWQQVYIYVLLIAGVVLFAVFFWIELKVAAKPLIPFDVLSVDVLFVLGCIVCGWAAFGIWIYYFFQFLQIQRGVFPLLSVAQASPLAVSGAIAAVVTGKVISRIGPGWVMFVAMCAFVVGNILNATAPVGQTYWAQTFIVTLIIPWGMDMSFPAGTLILSDAVPKKHQGMGASLVNTVVNYSISIGVGIAGTVEVHVSKGGKTQADVLKGYRAALYLASALSAAGMGISLLFLIERQVSSKRAAVPTIRIRPMANTFSVSLPTLGRSQVPTEMWGPGPASA